MQLSQIKVDKFTLAIIGSIAAIVLIITYLASVIFKFKPLSVSSTKQTPVSDILYLTSPVNSISGTIERVGGETIEIKFPEGDKSVNFTFKTTPHTLVFSSPLHIPYLFNTSTQTPPTIKIQDLKPGQSVTVSTDQDLRTTNPRDLVAISVATNPGTNSISGTITAINGNQITLKGSFDSQVSTLPGTTPTASPTENVFTITVDNSTEISMPSTPTTTLTPPEPKKLSLSDLTINSRITVYTDTDITSANQISAKLIRPQRTVVPPTAPAPSTVTP